MGSLNKVVLIGNLGADPEVKSFQNGGKVANLRIATKEAWKNRETGERQERTEWHTVCIFSEGLVGVAERYLRQGSKVYVEGKLQTRKWQDQAGNDRYSTEVVVRGLRGKLILLPPANRARLPEISETRTSGRESPANASPPKSSTIQANPTKPVPPKPVSATDRTQDPDPDWRPSEKLCVSCGEPITVGRMKALPETSVCFDCASSRPPQPRKINEPLGTRDDFKKDSGNNFGSAGTNRNF